MPDVQPSSQDANLCPYCARRQFAVVVPAELYRCPGCNFFIKGDWLVDDPLDYVLNNDRRWLCPWCAYPVAVEQEVPPENGEFQCGGCAGTLFEDMLVTQANVNAERKVSMRLRGYFILIALAVLFVVFVFGFVVG